MKALTLGSGLIGLGLMFLGLAANAAEQPRGGLATVDQIFQDNCAICHGNKMQGTPQGSALVGQPLVHGENNTALIESISQGFADKGMPAWASQFNA